VGGEQYLGPTPQKRLIRDVGLQYQATVHNIVRRNKQTVCPSVRLRWMPSHHRPTPSRVRRIERVFQGARPPLGMMSTGHDMTLVEQVSTDRQTTLPLVPNRPFLCPSALTLLELLAHSIYIILRRERKKRDLMRARDDVSSRKMMLIMIMIIVVVVIDPSWLGHGEREGGLGDSPRVF
jgi:hypothetical protein